MAKGPAPDQGWSWVIAFACCFSSLILAGIFRTSGVLFVAFISTFGVSREEASWPMVVCISVLNLAGPFCGILGQKIGARPVVIIGAVIATVGISTCYFTTSLGIITILFGGVFGVGYGFMNTVMPCILNAYFLNLRTLANGIANAGSCVGSIVLPIIFELFISTYDLSGCFLLTGGIVLHIAIAGSLMRDPPWLRNKKSSSAEDEHHYSMNEYRTNKSPMKDGVAAEECERNGSSDSNNETVPCISADSTEPSSQIDRKNSLSDNALNISLDHNLDESSQPCLEMATVPENSQQKEKSFINRKFQQVCLQCNRLPSLCKCEDKSTGIVSSFVTVLTSPMFQVTAITDVIFYFLYHMYVVIIVDYALDRGVQDTNTKHILFAFSIADLIGRLCFGWITDRKMVSRSRFVMMGMALIGMTFFTFPFANGYWSLIAASSCYGLLLGCTMVMFPILLVEFCGIELHTVSYGCMCFMNGFASFGRPLLIGYFRDHVGSYSKMFYVLGGISLFSSTLWFLEKPLERRSQGQAVIGNCKTCIF
ncbi:monocarboxylate transporter 9-like [Argiope bruennichi]|uniref:monocarboxylate transporter 9-like n=1 Tax=Argiope bruennichi TaxID=94029 RepID=UPI002495326E|nr:monocarboxylate transporter 9-like [Argiope bruennichi]